MATEEVINLSHQDLYIYIPAPSVYGEGKTIQCKLNWLLHLIGPFFEAGMDFADDYPHDQGATIWLIKQDAEKGFIPLFQAMWSSATERDNLISILEEVSNNGIDQGANEGS